MSNSNIDDLFPCISCGVNADPADGFGKCTCGNEAKREAIQQELLKARIETLKEVISVDKWYYNEDALFVADVNNRIANLQAKLKGDDK